MKFLNEEPLEHRGPNGTVFKAERCDLRTGVKVISKRKLQPHLFAQDLISFGAYHAHQIHPRLNGFSGYDAVTYEMGEPKPPKQTKPPKKTYVLMHSNCDGGGNKCKTYTGKPSDEDLYDYLMDYHDDTLSRRLASELIAWGVADANDGDSNRYELKTL